MEIKVSIPLVGGKIESLIADLLRKALRAENAVGRQLPRRLTRWRSRSRARRFDAFAGGRAGRATPRSSPAWSWSASRVPRRQPRCWVVLHRAGRCCWLVLRRGSTSSPGPGCAGSPYPLGLQGDGLHRPLAVRRASIVPWDGRAVRRGRAGLERPAAPDPAGPARPSPARAASSATSTPQMMEVVDRHGMRYSLRVLDIGVDELRQAFVVQSGGRVQRQLALGLRRLVVAAPPAHGDHRAEHHERPERQHAG